MLAADVFSAYWESGWEDKEAISKVSRRITRTLLSAGSSAPMVEIFRELRGRDPNPEALMISLGQSFNRFLIKFLIVFFSFRICLHKTN